MSKPPVKSAIKSPAEIPPPLAPLPHTTLAFCDGACKANPGKGGFGTVIILPNGEQIDIYGGEEKTTNNRMELMGAIMALQHSPHHLPIQIWTDSGYVKDGITKWLTGWKAKNWKKADGKPVLNQELWQQLDQVCQNRQVSWHWLKGHAGHAGNEYADTLANLGVTTLPTPITIKKKLNANFSQSPMTTPPLMNTNFPTQMPKITQPQDSDSFANRFFIDDMDELTDMEEENPVYPVHDGDYPDFNQNKPDFNQNKLGENQVEQMNALPHDGLSENSEQSMAFSQPQQNFSAPAIINPNLPINPLFQDNKGVFFAQSDEVIAKRCDFDGNTQIQNHFIPLLPLPKNRHASNRQLIMDTETTGFEATGGDRIIEIGIVELINRKPTGEKLHVYINPNKLMDEEVIRIHGITNEFLADKPMFEQIGKAVYEFMLGAELVAHNAPFDMSFLVAEFGRMGLPEFASQVKVVDSLVIAKQQYAGQRNTLDALVKRLNVGKQDRTFHGALLDAEILAEVYLAMTGGQVSLAIDDSVGGVAGTGDHRRFSLPVARFVADATSETRHLDWLNALKDQNPALISRWGMAEPLTATNTETNTETKTSTEHPA